MQARVPRSMLPVIEAIGFDAALCLVKACGGRTVYVHSKPRATDPLAMIVGLDRAQALARSIRPGPLEVPRCVGWMAALRREEMLAARAAGLTVDELSRRYGYTQRHVRNLLREPYTC